MHQLINLNTESQPNTFHDDHQFNWIARSDQLVVIEITMRLGRSDAVKSVLYAEIAANLQAGASVNTADIFIFMRENDNSSWSVVMANLQCYRATERAGLRS